MKKDSPKMEKFVEFRAKGCRYEEIAKKLDVSRQTLQNWSKTLVSEIEKAKSFKLIP